MSTLLMPARPSNAQASLIFGYKFITIIFFCFTLGSVLLEISHRLAVRPGFFRDDNRTILSLEYDYNPNLHHELIFKKHDKDTRAHIYPKCHSAFNSTKDAEEYLSKPSGAHGNESSETSDAACPVHLEQIMKGVSKVRLTSIFPSAYMIFIAASTLYVGSLHSTWLFYQPSLKEKAGGKDEKIEAHQAIQTNEALWFPIMGSIMLFSLYLVYKYLPKEYIQVFLTLYITILCIAAVSGNISEFAALIKGRKQDTGSKKLFELSYKTKLPYIGLIDFSLVCTRFDVVSLLTAFLMAGIYELSSKQEDITSLSFPFDDVEADIGIFGKSTNLTAFLNNFLGINFCIFALKKVTMSDYASGAVLLSGLFLYDIFWVFYSEGLFGSNVMVSVATSVNAPIKLLFYAGIDICRINGFSMLGLGDIVVPGFFMNFLAKFDCYRSSNQAGVKRDEDYKTNFLYFRVTMAAYILSLVVTVLVMLVFNHAQPALLYIVPFLLVTSFGIAVIKGEVGELTRFSTEPNQPIVAEVANESASNKEKVE